MKINLNLIIGFRNALPRVFLDINKHATIALRKKDCLNHLYYEKWPKIQNFQRGCHFSIRPLHSIIFSSAQFLVWPLMNSLDLSFRHPRNLKNLERFWSFLKFGQLIKRATGSSEQLLNALLLICTAETDDTVADQMFEKYSNQEQSVHLFKSDEF